MAVLCLFAVRSRCSTGFRHDAVEFSRQLKVLAEKVNLLRLALYLDCWIGVDKERERPHTLGLCLCSVLFL